MAEQLVTQVARAKIETAVALRRASVRERRESHPAPKQNNEINPGNPPPKETEVEKKAAKVHSLVASPRARGSSVSIHEQKPTAPYRDDHLLPPLKKVGQHAHDKYGFKCLVLDLDETLVHSSFKIVDRYDFVIPVDIEGVVYQVYVAKRPGVDEFLKRMGELYEVVIFTASLAKYADPVLDKLDIHKVVDWRLFRESCTCVQGTYVKDMGRMGRDLKRTMIIDNSPHSFAFNPENAIPCESWFDDYEERELYDLIPILEGLADESVTDVMEELERLQINGVAAVEQGVGDSDDSGSDSGSF